MDYEEIVNLLNSKIENINYDEKIIIVSEKFKNKILELTKSKFDNKFNRKGNFDLGNIFYANDSFVALFFKDINEDDFSKSYRIIYSDILDENLIELISDSYFEKIITTPKRNLNFLWLDIFSSNNFIKNTNRYFIHQMYEALE